MNFVKKFLNQDYSGYLVNFQLGWDENDSLIFKVIPLFCSFKETCNLLLEREKVIFNQ